MNFLPTPQQEQWIRNKVEAGNYANASEVLREALREKMERDRTREAKLHDLRAALDEAEASGDPVPLDMEKIKRNARARWNREHADKKA